MVDGGIGVSAAVAVGSKFMERSKFTARHDVIYDKEADKSVRLAERFDKIDKENVDQFELEAYAMLHCKSLQDLHDYRRAQEEYKKKEWYREPMQKYQSRRKVREGKRKVQSSILRESQHVDELEAYSRAALRPAVVFGQSLLKSGLNLFRSSTYRTDSCSLRAVGGTPPSSSMEDICRDEREDRAVSVISSWRSVVDTGGDESATDACSMISRPDLSVGC